MKTSSTRTSAKSMKQSSVIIKRANKTATPKRTAKTEPKRRRTLSGYNYFMKYHRAITVTGDEPSRVLIDPKLTRDEKRHYVDKIIANEPYRLNGGKKRPHRKSHGVIGFKELTLAVARTWKSLDVSTKSIFEDMAREDKRRNELEDIVAGRYVAKKTRRTVKRSRRSKSSLSSSSSSSSTSTAAASTLPTSITCTSSSSTLSSCPPPIAEEKMAMVEQALDISLLAEFEETEGSNILLLPTEVPSSSCIRGETTYENHYRPISGRFTTPSPLSIENPFTSTSLPLKVEYQEGCSSPASTISDCSGLVSEGICVPELESSLPPIERNAANITNQELTSFLSTLDWTLL